MASEPWIAVSRVLVSSPIVTRGSVLLGVHRTEIAGALVTLWGAIANSDRNGSLQGVPDDLLERWADWQGQAGQFAAFIRANHLDRAGRVKGWDEWNSKEAQQRALAAKRQRQFRAKAGPKSGGRNDVSNAASVTRSVTPVTASALPHTDIQTDKEGQVLRAGAREEPPASATPNGKPPTPAREPESWKQRKDQRDTDAVVVAELRQIIAHESQGGGPPQLPGDLWARLSDTQRDVLRRHGGFAAVWESQ